MTINTNPSTFLALPLEIRLEIYSYLYIHPTVNLYQKLNPLNLRNSHTRDSLTVAQNPVTYGGTIHLALLLACKQIHAEASSILYSSNTFSFNDPKGILAFLGQIGPVNTQFVRTLHIVVPWNQERWVFWPSELLCKLSSDAKNLRNIEITFERIPRSGLQIHCFGSHDDIVSLVTGRRLSLEFNLGLALRRMPWLERVVIWGHCSEGLLECLRKRIGSEVLLTRMIDNIDERCLPKST
jgi:hypothetical protein